MGATCLWGLSFVIPVMLPGVTAFDVSLGRYLIYGLLGAALFARQNRFRPRLGRKDMAHALLFAVTGYYGAYTVLVWAIDLIGPAVPTLIMGLTPVSVAVVGNLRCRDLPFSRLIGPLALIGGGLALANLARLGAGTQGRDLGAGLALSLLALAFMTHFLVANLLFLKARPHISPMAWANAIGVSVLALSLVALALRPALFAEPLAQAVGPSPGNYALGCAVLGLGSSWFGAVLWNRANAQLPVAVAGQCIVFWPISGILFAFVVQHRLPGPLEIVGIVLVFAGIFWGLRAFAVRPSPA